ncbi:prepilin-type N-terminal cleavage/methylation domain-containing protein [Acetobacterium sp.]|uniref:prepilin-type N-terminal cleavage/methylation domain-containing protein n=1 Tax=Acetobacterium sp. TaxID=1872094 RepID=UPI002718DB2D|nr:prepilin-type N-terminal cleavage/methylation domain-containing protein [Acetobacterium sp.]MDO9491061.1 prepilin-type N-terminal cleavage/methylation domain-containing protein [Acetobacterium sp.]
MKTNTTTKKIMMMDNKCLKAIAGYTLLELLISLSVLSLLTVMLFSTGFVGRDAFSETAYEVECEKILYALLQYQNEAIMDGWKRRVHFYDHGMQVIWTIDGVVHRDYIPVETLTFDGSYTGAIDLILHEHGTVAQAGTVKLISNNGVVRKLIVQVGNGRIYLDEP